MVSTAQQETPGKLWAKLNAFTTAKQKQARLTPGGTARRLMRQRPSPQGQ